MIGALLFVNIAGGFEGTAEQLFEGSVMLFGAALLTTMIFWMMQQKHIARELNEKASSTLQEAGKAGLFFLVFVSVLREGIETVIFLGAASFQGSDYSIVGALLGIFAAIILGYLMFVGSRKVNIKKFFQATTILLVLFSAGLVDGPISL